MEDVLVVVADGGSADRTLEIVESLRKRFPNLHIQRNPAKLQSAGVNAVVQGCARSEHVALVRCDAHAVYPKGYIRDVVASLAAQPEAASVAVPMDSNGHSGFGLIMRIMRRSACNGSAKLAGTMPALATMRMRSTITALVWPGGVSGSIQISGLITICAAPLRNWPSNTGTMGKAARGRS